MSLQGDAVSITLVKLNATWLLPVKSMDLVVSCKLKFPPHRHVLQTKKQYTLCVTLFLSTHVCVHGWIEKVTVISTIVGLPYLPQ